MKAIEVNNISKHYRIGLRQQKGDTFVGQLLNTLKSPINNFKRIRNMSKLNAQDETLFKALNDISFSVNKGEVLGIIGHNGAGKSTLLKILSRITEPTSGEIKLNGRVSALLEVGTGFHPELTGRDNIYMNGTILGMTKKEIDYKLDEIIDFSGIETHIDTPVKFYSSGMKVRLGFAVAANLEPEILIIDEVLAVGDAAFQKKCIGKMQHVSKDDGRTILFVSHDLNAVKALCTRTLLLNKGEMVFEGNTNGAIGRYANLMFTNKNEIEITTGKDSFELDRIEFTESVSFSEPISVKFALTPLANYSKMIVQVVLSTSNGSILYDSYIEHQQQFDLKKNQLSVFNLELTNNLLPGNYKLSIGLGIENGLTLFWMENVGFVQISKNNDVESTAIYPYSGDGVAASFGSLKIKMNG